jgi:murein DD-endopeptidase MepM/ murein hydrolase activator NlpD
MDMNTSLRRLVVLVLCVIGGGLAGPRVTAGNVASTDDVSRPHASLVRADDRHDGPQGGARFPVFIYPIGRAGSAPGDGFYVRHGYAVENTWYLPGYWHTGEDWYAMSGDTAGAQVYAIAAGTVVYAGSNYPGRVVIIDHQDGLFSMYGHLDPALSVKVGQRLERGALLGHVLKRHDRTPNHLHFEVRTFLTTRAVNGDAPRYAFRCGVQCAPGPGYWPMRAPDHPGALGWRHPTHVIASLAQPAGVTGEVVVASRPPTRATSLWSGPPSASGRRVVAELGLRAGERFPLLATQTGAPDARGTSASTYVLWYQIRLPDGRTGWVQAAVPSAFETGSDKRPATVYFNFYPVFPAGR